MAKEIVTSENREKYIEEKLQKKFPKKGKTLYHGSPDITWIDRGEKFDTKKMRNAPSKYMFFSPRKNVAETYAGLSELQRYKAEQGLGKPAEPTAGVREFSMPPYAKVYKIKDVYKSAKELGTTWGGENPLENLLDAAKAKGYDVVDVTIDGNNHAILNVEMLESMFNEKKKK